MRFLKIQLAVLLVSSVSAVAYADVQVDESLKANYSYVDLAQNQQEATGLLMLNGSQPGQTTSQESVRKSNEPDRSQCIVTNKQFVHCMR